MRLAGALFIVPLLLTGVPQVETEEAHLGACRPSFIMLSSGEPIRAEVGSWRIWFKVALVGCEERLSTLTEEELKTLQEEFREPSEWSNLLLVNKETTVELRRRAVQRVTSVLGRQVITDILFHDITILDHNVQ